MATTVGGIRVRILGDDSDLQKKLGDSAKQLAKYGAAAAAAGAAAATALTVQGLKAVDAQAKLARSLDTSIDSLRALKIAASDAGLEGLEGSMARLNRRLGAAEMGMGDAAKSVEALGLNLEELSGMDADERIAAIADAVRDSGVSMQQAARHAQNLGFEQAEAASFFMQGGEAIRSYRKEVKDLGLSLSDIDAAKVEAANDAFARLGLLTDGVRQQLAVQLAPAITKVSQQLVEEFTAGGDSMSEGISDAVDVGIDAFADFMDAASGVVDIISDNPISSQFGILGWVMLGPKGALIGAAIGATFDMIQEGLAKFGVGISENEDKARRLVNVQEDIARAQQIINVAKEKGLPLDSAQVQGAREEIEALKEIESGIAEAVGASSEAQSAYNEILNTGTIKAEGLAGGMRRVAEALRESREEAESGGLGFGDGRGDDTPGRPKADGQTEEEKKKQEQLEEQLQSRLETIREANMTELELLHEKFAMENEAINAAREQRLITEQEWDQLMRDQKGRQEDELTAIEEKAADARTRVSEAEAKAKQQALGDALSSISTLMNSESKKMFKIGKAAALAGALVDAYAAITGAYKVGASIGGPPLGAAYGAAAGLAAFQNVNAIRSASFGGGGGSPTASGGGSVTQNINAQGEGVRGQQESSRNLFVQGIDPNQMFSGRQLVELINEAQQDGAQLRIGTA